MNRNTIGKCSCIKGFYEQECYIKHCKSSSKERYSPVVKIIQGYLDCCENIVEIGCGVGVIQNIHSNYIGIDISETALKIGGIKKAICCDIEKLPLRSDSVSLVLSVATIEHIKEPERVLEEVDRVLMPRGICIFHDAWFCRPWRTTGITNIPWKQCSFRQKLVRLSIFFRELKLVRASRVVPQRIFRELKLFILRKPIKFDFKALKPNYDEFLISDSDAASSIDPHSVLTWFKSRGYRLVNGGNVWNRIMFRGYILVVQK